MLLVVGSDSTTSVYLTGKSLNFLKFLHLKDIYSNKKSFVVRNSVDLGTLIQCNVMWLSVGGYR